MRGQALNSEPEDANWAGVLLPLGLIAFLALFAAGVYPWTLCTTAVLGAAAHLLLARRGRVGAEHPAARRLHLAYLALLLFLLLGALPLPPCCHILFGPVRAHQHRTAAAALAEGAQLGFLRGGTPWFALTRNRAGTLRLVLLLVSALSVLLLVSALPRSRRRPLLRLLITLGALVGGLGYLGKQVYPQGDTLWWVYPIRHVLPGPVACFVNRNHFGSYLALLAAPALALAIEDAAHLRPLRALHALVCLGCLSLGLAVSHSRGALLAYAAGLVALGCMLLARRRFAAALALAAVVLLSGAVFCSLPDHPLLDRLQSFRRPLDDPSVQARLNAWRDTLAIWQTYPLLGAGGDGFRMTYPQARLTSIRGYRFNPENEYLHVLCEGGLAGASLVALLAAALLGAAFSQASRAGAPAAVRNGALAALAAAAVHAAGDAMLRLPLYTLTVAALAGLTVAWPQTRTASAATRRCAAPVSAAALLSAIALSLLHDPLRAADTHSRLLRADPPALRRALVWAPTSWFVWRSLGRAATRDEDPAVRAWGVRCVARATDYDPNNYRLWLYRGKLHLRFKEYPAARAAFARVRELRPVWPPVPEVPDA